MPGQIINGAPFRTITVKQLHPTFGAEVMGADFTNMSDEQFDEIKQAMAKVPFVVPLLSQLLIHHSTTCLSFAKPV
jgi:alpha-ketoglutarate-dependent 2,4-dichlorophenoxyacetate dioxygenase